MVAAEKSLREWTVEVKAVCRRCARTTSASAWSKSCEDARQTAVKVIRYRGWRLMAARHRYDDLCPECFGPLPTCELCGTPTPVEYADKHGKHITGVDFTCPACWREKFDQRLRERA